MLIILGIALGVGLSLRALFDERPPAKEPTLLIAGIILSTVFSFVWLFNR